MTDVLLILALVALVANLAATVYLATRPRGNPPPVVLPQPEPLAFPKPPVRVVARRRAILQHEHPWVERSRESTDGARYVVDVCGDVECRAVRRRELP